MSTLAGRNGEISYSLAGDPEAPGLVLLHSLGAGSAMWADQLADLGALRRIVIPDLPGHGGSGARPGDYALEGLCMDVLDVVDASRVERFDVCGISLGGQMAIWLAANHPGRVTRLVASNTALRVGTRDLWDERIRAVQDGGMEGIRESVVARFVTGDLGERRPEAYQLVHDLFGSIDPIGYAGCCAALRDCDLTEAATRIVCPTLLIGGSEDISTPPDQTEAIRDRVPGSTMTIIEHAAHLSNIDQPAAFNRAVVDFLAAD